MRFAFALVAFGIGTNALVIRQTSQCFQLESSGGASGILGQLGDGQNRVGGSGLPTGCYCLDSDGGFTDSNGRGCILTPPTTQFQCDVGATPTNGFAVGPNGAITYNGDDTFYACPVNDQGEYNVYTKPAPGQEKCVKISLGSAGSCGSGSGPALSSAAPPVETETKPAPPSEVPASEQPPYPTGPAPTQPDKPKETPPHPKPEQPPAPEHPKPEHPEPEHPPTPEQPPAPEHPPAPEESSYPARPPPSQPSQPGESPPKPENPPVPEKSPKPTETAPEVPTLPTSACDVPNIVTLTMTATMEEPSPPEGTYPVETPPGPTETPHAPIETPSGPGETPPAPSHPSSPSPPPSPSPPAHSSPPASPSPPSHPSCPEDLHGPYEYPHLIIPVSSSNPSTPSGSSYNGHVSPTTCTLFNFDIPASMAGKSCSTIFMLPLKFELETSDYTISGSGMCTISKLDGPATQQSTWKDKPKAEAQVASVEMTPGHSWTVDSGICEEGPLSYEVCGGGDFELTWFQDYNPSPIGLFVRSC